MGLFITLMGASMQEKVSIISFLTHLRCFTSRLYSLKNEDVFIVDLLKDQIINSKLCLYKMCQKYNFQ